MDSLSCGSWWTRLWILLTVSWLVFVTNCRHSGVFASQDGGAERDRQGRSINLDVINATSVTVRWSHLSKTSYGEPCPAQRYLIRLKQSGVRQSKAWKLEGDRQSVSLHDLQPSTEYQIRLTTVSCEGVRKHSRWVRLVTENVATQSPESRQEETQVPGQPTSVRTRTSSDSATVSWFPPDDNVLVRSYMIGYGEGVPDVKWIYVNGTQRNVTIQNLKPSTQYVVSVRAINKLGKGLVVYDLVFTRDASTARLTPASGDDLPAPVRLRTTVLSPHSVRLQWVDPSLDALQRITDERYYNVYYHAFPTGKNLSVIVKAMDVTLHDLVPDRLYRFKVRTVKGVQTSPFSETTANRTLPDTGSGGRTTGEDSIISLTNRTSSISSTNFDEYDYDNRDMDDDAGHIDVLQRPAGDQLGKTKRAHSSRGRLPLASQPQPPALGSRVLEELTSAANSNRTATSPSASSNVRVAFRSLVQYRISAYVTWPDRLPSTTAGSGCSASSSDGTPSTSSSAIAGYVFRYKAVDTAMTDDNGGGGGDYIVRNLATNFVLLDNLVPGVRYRYQVRYVPETGDTSGWSQVAELDTTHHHHHHQQQQRDPARV